MASLQHPSVGRSAAPLLAAGEILAGRFRIVARLGEGAIGEVYEAADLELEENIAVKVLRPEIAGDAEVLHRFKREIQLARKVTHPSVCRTFELLHHQDEKGADLAFVTMELLRGETLEERLMRAGRMTPAEALPLARQMAEGLHAAHQAGVVHRDFKSGNVMLVTSPEGPRAVVTDFGLAWSNSAAASVTRAGTLIGSPAYMSPEQVRGEPVTPATDVYALGIVLYEMVTASLPFSADTALGTAIKRLREPPTMPRVHAPDLDRQWEEVILRCLESAPGDRFATPIAAAQALGEPRRVSGYTFRSAVRRRRRAGIAALAAAVLLVAVVGGWLARGRLARSSAPPSPALAGTRPAVAVLGFENLARNPDLAYIETSLVRMLPSELAAGEHLRLVPSEQVDRARRDLGITAGGSGMARDTLDRLRGRLSADYLVFGSYFTERREGAVRIRCDITVQDVRTGETIDSFRQEGTEEEFLNLVDALGVRLRTSLRAGELSPTDQLAVQAARPASVQAARLYAEGLEKLSRFEALAATQVLSAARDADPGNALIRADLAGAWDTLGYQARAEEEAREGLARSAPLSFEPRRRVEARFYETVRQWEKAAATYRALWGRFPDDLEHGLGLARAQVQSGDPAAALLTVQRLRSLPAPRGEDPRIDLAEAEAAFRHAELARGLAAAEQARRKGEAQGAKLLVARALYFTGIGMRLRGQLAEARDASQRASDLFREAGDQASAAQALSTIGGVLSQQGDLVSARRIHEEVIAIGLQIGSQEIRGLGLTNLGSALSGGGDLEGARENYLEALDIFGRTGSKVREATVSANLARVYQRLGQRAEARAMDSQAAATFRELGDRGSEARVLANLADLLIEEGEVEPAWVQASRALDLHRAVGDASGVAEAEAARGKVLSLRGNLPAAERELRVSIAGFDVLGAKPAAARQRIELAQVLVDAGRPAEGEKLAGEALAGLGDKPSPDDEVAARSVRAAAALALRRNDAATAELQGIAAALETCKNRTARLVAVIVAARAHAAAGRPADAVRELQAAQAETETIGLRPLALEARLALGNLESASGHATGRELLTAVARDARAAGLGGIAQRAEAALKTPSGRP